MTTGLQTFDEQGNLVIDLTSRLVRYMGYLDVTNSAAGSKAISIPAGTTFFYFIVPLENIYPTKYPVDAKYENGVLSWTYININYWVKAKSRIIYGYY